MSKPREGRSRLSAFEGITAQVRLLALGMVLLLATAGLTGLVGVTIATSTVRHLADDLIPAADANEAVLQDMTDAETGLRGWLATDDRTFLQPYTRARVQVRREQAVLRRFAADNPELKRGVAEQDRAVADWFSSYAQPRLAGKAGPASVSHQRLLVGKQKFDRLRRANGAVSERLDAMLTSSKLAAFRELPWIVFVLLFVAVLGAVATLFARRAAGRITVPLVDMQQTVDRLSRGDLDARTRVAGPREVRRVGHALNRFADQNARLLDLERQAIDRLQGLDRAKSDFLSNVSHELRTPLTSIAGYVELFEDDFPDGLTPQQRNMLAVVNRNVARLKSLIEDLLALSQAESQTFRTSFDQVDLDSLVTDVAQDVRALAAERRIVLREEHEGRSVMVNGDASQLSRGLLNLVSNAVKFSHDGGTVTVGLRESEGEVLIEVTDQGIGIPTQDMANLATRFFRASNAVDAEISGTGLGLRIVHTIMDNHGGRLEVESVEGEGTLARLVLPAPGKKPRSSTVAHA